jgi:hypothetical protein
MSRTLQDSYESGYKSFGKIESTRKGYWHLVANPLKRNTLHYKEWERGINTAYYDNLKKVKKREQTRAGS